MNAIDSANISKPVPKAAKPKGGSKRAKARPAKKAPRGGKAARKPSADRTNKKAEAIAMMKRAKGATLVEIMSATNSILSTKHRWEFETEVLAPHLWISFRCAVIPDNPGPATEINPSNGALLCCATCGPIAPAPLASVLFIDLEC